MHSGHLAGEPIRLIHGPIPWIYKDYKIMCTMDISPLALSVNNLYKRNQMKLNDKKLQHALIDAGLTQGALAEKLGKTPAWITSMKAGNFTPSEKDAKSMASFLGCELGDIFDEVEK